MVDRSLQADVRLAASFAAATSTLMIAQQIASKSLRDAFFLTHFPASSLPILMIGAAVLSLGMVIAMGRLMEKFSPARLVPAMFLLSAALYAGEWMVSTRFPRIVAIAVYAHTVTFGASAVSGFWSVINERFDPYVAKRVVGTIGGGATFGGLLGGVAVWQGAPHVETETLLLVLAIANVACGVLLSRVGGRTGARSTGASTNESRPSAKVSVPQTLRETPYLRHIGLFVLLLAMGTAWFDYVFKARSSEQFADGDQLLTFFALFYTLTGVGTFAVQNVLVRHALVRAGLGPTLGVLPLLIVLFGVGSLVFPGFYSVIALRGVALTGENSFHRSSYELLYTPLSPSRKRATKLVIDVGADRIGTAVGSGIALALIAGAGGAAETWMLMGSTVVGAALVCVLLWLHRGYVAALAESMRSGTANLDPALGGREVDSNTAKQALARTVADLDVPRLWRDLRQTGDPDQEPTDQTGPESANLDRLRQAILVHQKQRRVARESRSHATPSSSAVASPAADGRPPQDPLLEAVVALRSADPDRVRTVLRWPEAERPAVIGQLILLLDRPAFRPDVEPFLRRHAPRVAGQLVDVLLSPRHAPVVRSRVAHLLAAVPMERASQGLQAGLGDRAFDVAHQCAVALLRQRAIASDLGPDRKTVFEHVKAELERTGSARRGYHVAEGFERSPFLAHAQGNVTLQLVHIFTLLALHLDLEPLMFAFQSLQASDAATRGTALEYLENVLPSEVRRKFTQRLDPTAALTRRSDADVALAAELGRALARGELSLVELRAKYGARRRVTEAA